MKIDEVFCHTFKALRHELGQDRLRDTRPMWQRRLSTASEFCRALVACGYLTEEQMQRAAQRYRLGTSRDGGVIFWQIDEHEVVRDGKIMYYRDDCHRDHDHKPTWTSYLMRKAGQLPEDWRRTCVQWQHPAERALNPVDEQNAIGLGLKNLTRNYHETLGPDWQRKLLETAEELEFMRAHNIPDPRLQTVSGGVIQSTVDTSKENKQ